MAIQGQSASKIATVGPYPELAGRRVVIYLPYLAGGGAERLYLNLAPEFIHAGLKVTILVDRTAGELAATLPQGVTLETLGAQRTRQAIPRLASYLRRAQPDILLSALSVNNVAVLWARALARLSGRASTRILVSQHNTLSQETSISPLFRALPTLYRLFLSWADSVVAVSRGVAEDLASCAGIPVARTRIIYNGVVDEGFAARARADCPHPWYAEPGTRIFVALGRFTEQKDFTTLINAFAAMPADPRVRLVILGEGPLRETLLAQIAALGLGERVALPGYVHNPLPYITQAHALVLSSRYEGFGLVLAEALACGTPVISTDCPYGPAEILDHGRFGTLVPVGDRVALAKAMTDSLTAEVDREQLRARGYVFSIRHCAEQYLSVFAELMRKPDKRQGRES